MVGIGSLNWKYLIIFMTIYVLSSQTIWYLSSITYVKAEFSSDGKFENGFFILNFSLHANMPLNVRVALIPVTEKPANLPIYVFYDPDYPALGTSWERVHMLQSNLKRELLLRNFGEDVRLLNAEELKNLMSTNEKAVVIIASGSLPANVFSRNEDLAKRWLNAGGVLVWFGWPPGYYTVYRGQRENETFCLLPQHPFEEGIRRLGLENIVKAVPYENVLETAEESSYFSEVLDINYNLVNYGALIDSMPENCLALGKIGGNPLRCSVSVIPVGMGKIVLFGFFVFSSYVLNGPELSARDIAQILCSGVIYATNNFPPVFKEYDLSKGESITDEIKVKIELNSNIKGVIVYVYSTLSSNCLLYRVKFFLAPDSSS